VFRFKPTSMIQFYELWVIPLFVLMYVFGLAAIIVSLVSLIAILRGGFGNPVVALALIGGLFFVWGAFWGIRRFYLHVRSTLEQSGTKAPRRK
jgi:type VI protein secretion system component VasK